MAMDMEEEDPSKDKGCRRSVGAQVARLTTQIDLFLHERKSATKARLVLHPVEAIRTTGSHQPSTLKILSVRNMHRVGAPPEL